MSIILNNQKKSKQVKTVNKIKERKVVEHNDLISSVAKMDKTPLKIFELSVSCIDTENPPKDNTIYLSKKELFKFFDVSDNDKHTRFKQAIEKMQEQAFFKIQEEKTYKIGCLEDTHEALNKLHTTIKKIIYESKQVQNIH